jgi:threonine aldolase
MTRARFPDQALRGACSRFLGGHGRVDARLWVERLAQSPALDEALDIYSDGPAMARLEAETAALLGKEAALFFHKGITAQQAALLVHAANTGCRVVALHPSSHFALDEHDTLDRLAGLVSRRVGAAHAPFTVAELERVAEPLAAVTVELPLRRAGFVAPAWEELAAISHWARGRGTPFHLDGARIWEVAPWYGRSLAEIAALADTVYVSFYKGLGGMGGCVLAGPSAVLAAARPWRNRFGGDLPTIFPYVLTALDGLKRHLPRMSEYHGHAVAIAAAIVGQPGLRPRPAPPHGNSFQIHFDAPAAAMEAAATAIARETGVWLFNRFEEVAFPDRCFGELVVGAATLGWSPQEVAATLAELLARAKAVADGA